MRVSVVLDCADPERLVPFWSAALGYTLAFGGGEADEAQYRVLQPSDGEPPGPVFILQKVPEARDGKNRAHLDVHADAYVEHVVLLESLGGTRIGEPVAELGHRWQRMRDPEGNEFCVVDASLE